MKKKYLASMLLIFSLVLCPTVELLAANNPVEKKDWELEEPIKPSWNTRTRSSKGRIEVGEVDLSIFDANDFDVMQSDFISIYDTLVKHQQSINGLHQMVVSTDEKLSASIVSLTNKHNQDIANLTNKHNTDVQNLTNKINTDVDTLRTETTTKITNLTNKHNQDVTDLNTTITNKETALNTRITNLTNAHNTDVTKIKNFMTAVDSHSVADSTGSFNLTFTASGGKWVATKQHEFFKNCDSLQVYYHTDYNLSPTYTVNTTTGTLTISSPTNPGTVTVDTVICIHKVTSATLN